MTSAADQVRHCVARVRRFATFGSATLVLAILASVHSTPAAETTSGPVSALTLDDCITTALQNNQRRTASRFAVAAAEAQHRQALAAYWPQVQLAGSYQRLDEAPNFLFPATQMGIPAQTTTIPPSTAFVTVPAGVLGPNAVQLPVTVPAQTVGTPAQGFMVPGQDVKLMSADNSTASLSLQWLLYDGGARDGLRQQSNHLVAATKEEARRSDLEIVDSVTRMFYGAIFARELNRVGTDTLARMEAMLSMTESLYQGGPGKVTKADYLENKVAVESLRAFVAMLEKNEELARAALANVMGLPWQASVTPQGDLPAAPAPLGVEQLVAEAYEFSPDWKRVEAGLGAAEAAVQVARSGHAPRVALTGNLHRWWNKYDAGLATAENKQGWTAGIGLEVPLFDGLLTRERIAEARARLEQLKSQRLLLKEGLGLQIKDVCLRIAATDKAMSATQAAEAAATENRELNIRAYQSELVETEKVIRAQLTEAFMTAQHLRTRYENLVLQSQLNVLIGRALRPPSRQPSEPR